MSGRVKISISTCADSRVHLCSKAADKRIERGADKGIDLMRELGGVAGGVVEGDGSERFTGRGNE